MRLQGCPGLRILPPRRHQRQFCSSSNRQGGMLHPATSDALDFVPVKSKNRSSHSTSRCPCKARRSVEISQPGLKPTKARSQAGQVGLVRLPTGAELFGLFWRLVCPHSNQSYFAPRGDNNVTRPHCQHEVISKAGQGVARRTRTGRDEVILPRGCDKKMWGPTKVTSKFASGDSSRDEC